ncbi:MAG: tetratricopeptide repeat protein [Dehalococcoidia bacterium]|nr:tetratricopeptide repeat protein [Dehalococcoidia bacterium]
MRMAVQGISAKTTKLPPSPIAFGLAAALAAALSLAAALVGLGSRGQDAPPAVTAIEEAAARNQRIAFFEARAEADVIDFVSLNTLAREYLQRARETGDVSDYERAEIAATRSLEILPANNFSGLVSLAAVRFAQHDFAAALTLGQQAVSLKPDDPAGYGVRGDALLGVGRYKEAEGDYQKMVLLEPSLPALSRLAGLAYLTGNEVNTVDFWRQSIAAAEGLPAENLAWAHTQLGGVYFALGETSKAEKEYAAALRVYPGHVPALAGLASVRSAQDRPDEALDLAQRAVARLPRPQNVTLLADLYLRAGRAEDAAAQYALVDAIDALYRDAGINTDLQLALFYADHNRNLERALTIAATAYEAAPGIYSADALAWVLPANTPKPMPGLARRCALGRRTPRCTTTRP